MKKVLNKKLIPHKKLSLIDISLITLFLGLVILYVNISFFHDRPGIFSLMNLVSIVLIIGVPLIYMYAHHSHIKKIEEMFPRFLGDITSNIATGMTLPQAIRTLSNNDYGVLTKDVKDMSAKISFGIPFHTVLDDFAKHSDSKQLKRTIKTIIETHHSGGKIDVVLESIAQSLREVQKINKERSASVYAQIVDGYLIFFIFLGVMIGLSAFLVPAFQSPTTNGVQTQNISAESIGDVFQSLAVIQGIFAGISIGKLSEGTLIAGLKHSFVLGISGYSAFLIFA